MFKKTVKHTWFWLLPALLAGCQTAPTVRLPSSAASTIKTVQISPVEAPPLEVLPDLLETRMPNYAHEYNMVLPSTAEEAVYRSPGGILIAGKVGHGDSVQITDQPAYGEEPTQADHWAPTRELSAAAEAQLGAAQIRTELNPQVARLPMAAGRRNANIANWRNAIDRWYGQNTGVSIGRTGTADAVLEIGLGQYRIFEGQTSLQVLVKLIDARTGQVLAKTGKKTFLVGDAAPGMLYPDGERFKALVRENGARLVAEAIQDIGLAPLRLSKLEEPLSGSTVRR